MQINHPDRSMNNSKLDIFIRSIAGRLHARFLLMIGYTGACRTDFSELISPQKVYPVRDTDSRLRKMVLNKNMFG